MRESTPPMDFEAAKRAYEQQRQAFEIECLSCHKVYTVHISRSDYWHWQNGTNVQHAFPYLTADDRELFVSRTCGSCYDKMFPPEEGD